MQTYPGGQSPFQRTMCQNILQCNLNHWDGCKRSAPIAWPTAKQGEDWKWHDKPLKYSNPEWWNYHNAWIGIFQWLVVPLPILALLGGRPRYWRTAFATIPMFQVALQYVLAHRALEGRLTIGIGLHAVNGALLLIVATFLAIGCADQKMSA